MKRNLFLLGMCWAGACLRAQILVYSAGLGDPQNAYDAPVPGFVGPHGDGKARIQTGPDSFDNPDNIVNPLFFGWATEVVDYRPAPEVSVEWLDSTVALGPVSGDHFDVVSLGDLNEEKIGSVSPGQITLTFAKPIRNKAGADFVIFENAMGGADSLFAELAYVEVSSDGENFIRFPSESWTGESPGFYGMIDPRNVWGLAGKHVNAEGESWGTPFDLSDLPVALDAITHVRIVDIPGSGYFTDRWGNPIYDSWLTWGSGGFDLEAVGVISQEMRYEEWAEALIPEASLRGRTADAAGDGLPNLFAYALGRAPTLPDHTPATRAVVEAGRLHLEFTRDERAVDLIYEVQVSSDLAVWTTFARSEEGQPFAGVDGHEPGIHEESASEIATVGVIRRVRVSPPPASAGPQFLRLRITEKQP